MGVVLMISLVAACGTVRSTDKSIDASRSGRAADDWFYLFDVPPMITHFVEPTYPAEAEKNNLEGVVRVKVLVGPSGRAEASRVVYSSNPIFERPALTAATQWRFDPAELEGKVVRAAVVLPVFFRLSRSGAY